MKMKIFLVLFLLYDLAYAQKRLDKTEGSPAQKLILDKAYAYMSNDQYDSAQYCLNKIYSIGSSRKPTRFAYYLTTCQAEIYYYNNLHLLGLQESLKGETIDEILKDSVLMARNVRYGIINIDNSKGGTIFIKQGEARAVFDTDLVSESIPMF